MTNSDAEKNARPGIEPVFDASWRWLQNRVPATGLALYDNWLSEELVRLEGQYLSFITKRSLTLSFRSDLKAGR